MNPNQQDPTLEDSVKEVMKTLPPVIRKYLAEESYTPVVQRLAIKYGLRVDQVGVLEREVMLLLMGIENPDEFMKALVEEAKLDQTAVSNIVEDVNARIFVPLRQQEEGQGIRPAAPPTPSRPVTNTAPQPMAGERFLEDHEEPHIEFTRPSAPPPPPPPVPPRPSVPAFPQVSRPASPRPYTVDPYREPFNDEQAQ